MLKSLLKKNKYVTTRDGQQNSILTKTMPLFYAKPTEKEVITKLIFSNKKELHDFLEADKAKGYKGSYIVTIERESKKRSPKQNNAIHKYCELLAKALNEAGLDMKKVLKPTIDISWNMYNVKEYLWRPIQKVLTGKESTKDLDKTKEIEDIHAHLDRHFSEKHGIHVPFPTEKKDEFDIKTIYPINNLGENKF